MVVVIYLLTFLSLPVIGGACWYLSVNVSIFTYIREVVVGVCLLTFVSLPVLGRWLFVSVR